MGRTVRLYEGNGSYQEAVLLSTRGSVYDINGQIHMGHAGQVVLPALPENLVSKPTLAWLLRNTRPAPQRVEASYLTGGRSRRRDYLLGDYARDTPAHLTPGAAHSQHRRRGHAHSPPPHRCGGPATP